MCPDSKLLSAFYDGEVASPWKEKIEDHLKECSECRSVVEGYSEQSKLLQAADMPEVSGSYGELQMLIRHRSNVSAPSQERSLFRTPFIPMAAAAAAVLAFFLGFATAGTNGPSATYADIPLALSEGWSVPPGDLQMSGSDVEAMLSLIEQNGGSSLFNQEVSMDLPVNVNLVHVGESELLRNAAFGGSSR
ncbi:MAG: zf-HC2 domain-containing protein [Spirochaetales bacterium]|nr:zf-HC2 domain-containing protein [Spirochaetales bacterium]